MSFSLNFKERHKQSVCILNFDFSLSLNNINHGLFISLEVSNTRSPHDIIKCIQIYATIPRCKILATQGDNWSRICAISLQNTGSTHLITMKFTYHLFARTDPYFAAKIAPIPAENFFLCSGLCQSSVEVEERL